LVRETANDFPQGIRPIVGSNDYGRFQFFRLLR